MRRIGIFVSMIGLLGITFCFAEEETITITTYYPSPFGVYKCLRLAPYPNCGKNPGPCGDCDDNSEGTMCYNGDEGLLYICNDPGGWQIASGLWEKEDSDAIHPREETWKVGIGTDDPASDAKLTIEGSIDNNIAGLFWRSKEADCNAVGFLGVGRGSDYGTVDDNVLIGAVGASYTNLIFRTDNKNRMMITNDGRVGIGTIEPDDRFRLDVRGGLAVYGSIIPSYEGTGVLNVSGDGTGTSWDAYSIINLDSPASGTWGLWHEKSTGNFAIHHGNPPISDCFVIEGTGGNVGIGTTDPASDAKLTIEGSLDNNIAGLFWRAKEADCKAVGFLGVGRGSDYGTVDDNVLIGATAASYTNLIFRTDNKNRMMITNDGNVGIGTITPEEKLDVAGYVKGRTGLCIGNDCRSSWPNSSDISLKKNVQIIPGALEKVLQLEGVSFEWKSNSKKGIGLIAQDVEKIFPELVITHDTGLKSLEYSKLVAPLIEAVKTQQEQINNLEKEIKKLKKLLNQKKQGVKSQ